MFNKILKFGSTRVRIVQKTLNIVVVILSNSKGLDIWSTRGSKCYKLNRPPKGAAEFRTKRFWKVQKCTIYNRVLLAYSENFRVPPKAIKITKRDLNILTTDSKRPERT